MKQLGESAGGPFPVAGGVEKVRQRQPAST